MVYYEELLIHVNNWRLDNLKVLNQSNDLYDKPVPHHSFSLALPVYAEIQNQAAGFTDKKLRVGLNLDSHRKL